MHKIENPEKKSFLFSFWWISAILLLFVFGIFNKEISDIFVDVFVDKNTKLDKTTAVYSKESEKSVGIACPPSGDYSVKENISPQSQEWKTVQIAPRCDFKVWFYDENDRKKTTVLISPGGKPVNAEELMFEEAGHLANVRSIGFKSNAPVTLTVAFYPFGILYR